MGLQVSNILNIGRLVLIVLFFLFIIYLIYYFSRVSELDQNNELPISGSTLVVICIFFLIVAIVIGGIAVFNIYFSPYEKLKMLETIRYTKEPVLVKEGNELKIEEERKPTLIGKIIDLPFKKIKIQNSKGEVITVTRVKDDLYVDEDGIYYDCILDDCILSKKNKPENEAKNEEV